MSSSHNRLKLVSGLSFDAVDFLQGNDEETIRASADKFKSIMGRTHTSPEFKNEPDVSNERDASVRKLAQGLAKK